VAGSQRITMLADMPHRCRPPRRRAASPATPFYAAHNTPPRQYDAAFDWLYGSVAFGMPNGFDAVIITTRRTGQT
jgi:hypothetical protein